MTRVLRKSYLTANAINAFLANTPMRGLGGVALQAEAETGIAADILIGICGAETSYGAKGYATSKEFNNLTNWGVGDVTITSEARFKSFTDCLLKTAHYIKDRHLNPSNWRFKECVKAGLDPYSLEGIHAHYASDKNWVKSVLGCRADIMARQTSLVSMKQYAGGFLFDEPVDWTDRVYVVVGYASWKHDGRPL